MARSLSRIYLHIIFSTKYRQPLIRPEIEQELFRYVAGILKNMGCTAIEIGGVSDHIHVLNIMSRTISVSKMIGILKKDSSKWLKRKGDKFRSFRWQDGYGVYSVSESAVENVRRYIQDQHRHHNENRMRMNSVRN